MGGGALLEQERKHNTELQLKIDEERRDHTAERTRMQNEIDRTKIALVLVGSEIERT